MQRSLTALLPVHNVESTLAASVAEILDVLPELTPQFELVLIDDGSADATIEVADDLAMIYPQMVATRNSTPQGRGAAIRAGVEHSIGDIVFLADDPCLLAIGEVRRLWERIEGHEFVLGRPVIYDLRSGDGFRYTYSGGYMLAHRRPFLEMLPLMTDQAALVTSLERSGRQWHEVEVSPRSPSRPPVRRLLGQALDCASRPERFEESAASCGEPRQPNYLTRLAHLLDV